MKKLICIILSVALLVGNIGVCSVVAADIKSDASLKEFTADFTEMVNDYEESSCDFNNLGSAQLEEYATSGTAENDNSYNITTTNRLIVKSEKEVESLDAVGHVCGYNDLHILQFDNYTSFINAYNYYSTLDYVEYLQEDEIIEEAAIEESVSDAVVTEATVDKPTQLQSAKFGYTAAYNNLASKGASSYARIDIAVVDSGIQNDHPLLKGRVEPTGFDSINGVSCYDDRGHGTHVAGIIASNTLENVVLHPYKVLDSTGSGTETQVYLGIEAAIEDGVDIINLSLTKEGESDILQEAVTHAYEQGITVIVAAGNKNVDLDKYPYSPACFDEVIAVMACTDTRYVASFSNHGYVCDVAAPGVDILSSYLNNTYKYMSGTSSAAPFICAAASYLLSVNPSLTPDTLKSTLLGITEPLYGTTPGRCVYPGTSSTYSANSATPVLSYASCTFSGFLTVSISCTTADSRILYKTDSMQDKSYYEYTGPIKLTDTATITAFSVASGKVNSSSTSATYTMANHEPGDFTIDENGYITGYFGTTATVTVPDYIDGIKVLGVEEEAFMNNTQITSVTFSSSVTDIKSKAFSGCTSLATVKGTGVLSVGDECFCDCTALSSLSLSNVTTIGNKAFYGCSALKTLIMSKAISVGDSAFENATSLTSFNAANVASIGARAFYGCTKLMSLSISKVSSLGESAFEGCSSLKSVSAPQITDIPADCFKNCTSLINAILTNAEIIGDYAFYNTAIKALSLSKVISLGTGSFENCGSLTTVTLPSLTHFCADMFKGCEAVTSFTLNGITSADFGTGSMSDYFPLLENFSAPALNMPIPANAFKDCMELTSVNFYNAPSVGDYAFFGTSLTSAVFHSAVTVGNYAFYSLPLSTIDFSSTTQAGDYAFSDIETLTDASFPSLLNLNKNTFIGTSNVLTASFDSIKTSFAVSEVFTNLTSFSAPLLETVPDNMFKDCVNLEAYDLKGAKSVGDNAFTGTAITSVYLPAAVTIGDKAFTDCTKLTSINLPACTQIDLSVFEGSRDNVTTIRLNAIKEFKSTTDERYEFCVFPLLQTFSATLLDIIPENCFKNCVSLKSLTVTGAEVVGASAFENCTSLESIDLQSATDIGKNALLNCTNLKTFKANSATELDFDVLSGCSKIGSIYVNSLTDFPLDEQGALDIGVLDVLTYFSANALTKIPDNFFLNYPSLITINARAVTEIGSNAFKNTSLKNYYFGSVTDIGEYAFYNTALTTAKFETAVNIGSYAFSECVGLTSAVLTQAVNLGEGAFENAVAMTSFTNDDYTLISIGDRCFRGCTGLTGFSNSSVQTLGDYAFADCTALKSVVVTGALSFGEHTFENDTALTSVRFSNDNIIEIPDYCFKNCKSLSYGGSNKYGLSSVFVIGDEAFYNCSRLTEDAFDFTAIESIGENAFYNTGISDELTLDLCSLRTVNKNTFNGLDIKLLLLENAEYIYDLPENGTVAIGSAVKVFDIEATNAKIYAPRGSAVEDYCLVNNLDYGSSEGTEPVLLNVADSFSIQNYEQLSFEAVGFNLTYEWFACNKEDRSDAVSLGLTAQKVNPVKYLYDEHREADFKYYYCVATSTENGNEHKIYSSLCRNLLNVVTATEDTVIDYEELIIYTHALSNINDLSKAIVVDGDVTLNASHCFEAVNAYGTGTVIDVNRTDGLKESYSLVVYGDVNGDAVCDAIDLALIEREYVDGDVIDSRLDTAAADLDGDFSITTADYQAAVNKALA